DGRWWDEDERTWRNGRGRALRRFADDVAVRTTRIVLAAAHLDHDPTNNRLRNLKALCQRCHMLRDREEHRRRRVGHAANAEGNRRPVSWLFASALAGLQPRHGEAKIASRSHTFSGVHNESASAPKRRGFG